MAKQEVVIDYDYYNKNECNFDDLKSAVGRLTSATESQFDEIKKEKWYNRVFDMVTFSKKNQKRMAEQIGSVAQAQQILMEILVRLSETDEKISDLVAQSFDKIKQLSENDIFMMAKIRQLENLCILGITKSGDIASLSEKEKQILSGCLFFLMGKFDVISENQKAYANKVLRYIGTEAKVDDVEKALNSVENVASKKKILSCCVEYIFLNNNQIDIVEKFEGFIDCFDFGNKTIKEIKQQVNDIYKLRGESGFLDKYGTYDEVETEFFVDFGEEFEENYDQESMDEPDEIEDALISSILHISVDETKIFKNKNVHISSYINCDGNLVFEKCNLFYNESDASDEITLNKGASLKLLNCTVTCLGLDITPFINAETDTIIEISNCEFTDCSYFLKLSQAKSVIFENSKITDGNSEFIKGYLKDDGIFKIANCLICENDIKYLNEENKRDWFKTLIEVSAYSDSARVEVTECTVIEGETFKQKEANDDYDKMSYFNVCSGNISSCTFIGASNCIKTNGNVSQCSFENCSSVINLGSNYLHSACTVDNCTFKNCSSVIPFVEKGCITNCQFIGCTGKLITAGFQGGAEVSFCEFLNTEYIKDNFMDNGCIEFRRSKMKDACSNTIKKCIFDGARLNEGFLIYCSGVEKPFGTVAYVEDCNFVNCSTKRSSGKIVKEYITYDTLLKKNVEFQATSVSSCKGLDKVNKESDKADYVRVKTESTTGMKIGSIIAGNLAANAVASMGAIALGPVGVLVGAAGVAVGIINLNKSKDTVVE